MVAGASFLAVLAGGCTRQGYTTLSLDQAAAPDHRPATADLAARPSSEQRATRDLSRPLDKQADARGDKSATADKTTRDVGLDRSTKPDSATPAPDVTPSVTLFSVSIVNGVVTVVYGKNFPTCVHLLTAGGTIVHTQNFFCTSGSSVSVTQPLTSFTTDLAVGAQVKLCHGNNYGICSAVITVTS